MRFFIRCAVLMLAAGCTSVGTSHITQTFNFSFDQIRDGWIPGAADYPAAQAATVAAFGDLQGLPAPLTGSQDAVYLRGTNVTGGLFLFQKRYFTGLAALSTYDISLQVEFATNYQSGCTTGPGPITNLRAGTSAIEPLTATDGSGIVQLNLETGADADPGAFIDFGDIRNGLAGCPATGTFALRTTLLKPQASQLTTDANGGFWFFVGTKSTFAGQHEIYISGMKLVVEAQ